MSELDIYSTSVLLTIATVVALVARRFKLPYTVGLVITGLALTLFHIGPNVALTQNLIYDFLLPPLLFEAALAIHWNELKRDRLVVSVLVLLGVIVSEAVVGFGMAWIFHWSWQAAMLFGVLIAATDPVSVIATFKEIGITGRLRLLVESESLLNDGVAAVLFTLAVALASGTHVTLASASISLVVTVVGGILVGACSAGIALLLSRGTTDHLVETALTAAVAYGSFLQAEHFHVSGVLATVVAGLVMGNGGMLRHDGNLVSERGRETVTTVWEFAAFVSNSLIFLLIGARVERIPFQLLGFAAIFGAIGLVLLGRVISVYPLCFLFARCRHKVELRHQHVLVWGGLRGALALALAISLPHSIVFRDQIVIATFAVVAFSIIVQGITMPLLIRRLGLKVADRSDTGSTIEGDLVEGKS